jgi:4-hydroxybenzoate polyprenyltransferase
VAGYLAVGSPDINALLFALFFYPLAMAHLGVNDIIDVANDQARGLKTIPTLYGMAGTSYWILAFSAIHFVTASVFLTVLGLVALPGFAVSLSLIAVGNYLVLKSKTAVSGIKALPLFHVAMLIYAVSIIVVYFVFSTLAV